MVWSIIYFLNHDFYLQQCFTFLLCSGDHKDNMILIRMCSTSSWCILCIPSSFCILFFTKSYKAELKRNIEKQNSCFSIIWLPDLTLYHLTTEIKTTLHLSKNNTSWFGREKCSTQPLPIAFILQLQQWQLFNIIRISMSSFRLVYLSCSCSDCFPLLIKILIMENDMYFTHYSLGAPVVRECFQLQASEWGCE